MKPRLFLSPPHMGGEESRLIHEAFESNYIAPLGPMVEAFEKEFARVVKAIRKCWRTRDLRSATAKAGKTAV